MTILVIGAYGLIGSGVTQHLLQNEYTVIGLGRDIETGKRVIPSIQWRTADVATLITPDTWHPHLEGIDTVVNCSGALQDGLKDSLEALHNHAVAALATACAAQNIHLIQISAVGATPDASTPFLASKARGDAAIQNSGCRHHILRPGLVIAPHSYGGTTLLRMLAAIPVVQPLAMPNAPLQTVALDDVATTVSAAIEGTLPDGLTCDVIAPEEHTLHSVTNDMRTWLGFSSPKFKFTVPNVLLGLTARVADGLGKLGWRSPLRSTAFKVLTDGVTGTATDLTKFGLPPVKSFSQTLATMPARAEDRLFARMALIFPIIMATLISFWFLSGVIGFARVNVAAQTLENVGWPRAFAILSVLFWAIVDIAIAATLAYRPTARLACWAAIAVSLFYLAASTLFVPALWADPLGPLIKIFPSITLALVARIALDTR